MQTPSKKGARHPSALKIKFDAEKLRKLRSSEPKPGS